MRYSGRILSSRAKALFYVLLDSVYGPLLSYLYYSYTMLKIWDDLRCFLAVAETERLSAAAQKIGKSQISIVEQIEGLEESLDAKLFILFGERFTKTELGKIIFLLTLEIEETVLDTERFSGKRESEAKGKVSIAITECMASYWLVSKLPLLSQRYPKIDLEILTGINGVELLEKKADITLCLGETNSEMWSKRKVGWVEFGLYVSDEYLRKFGEPKNFGSLRNHRVIQASGELANQSQADALRNVVEKSEIAFSTNSILVQYMAATDGLGIAVLPNYLVDGSLNLQRLLPAEFSIKHELWLLCHHHSMETSTSRYVLEFLTDSLKKDSQLFCRNLE